MPNHNLTSNADMPMDWLDWITAVLAAAAAVIALYQTLRQPPSQTDDNGDDAAP